MITDAMVCPLGALSLQVCHPLSKHRERGSCLNIARRRLAGIIQQLLDGCFAAHRCSTWLIPESREEAFACARESCTDFREPAAQTQRQHCHPSDFPLHKYFLKIDLRREKNSRADCKINPLQEALIPTAKLCFGLRS